MKKFLLVCTFFLTFSTVAHAAPAYERIFYYYDSPAARESLAKNIDKIDIFAPQIYSINSALKPYSTLKVDIKTLTGNHRLKVMPLITNDHFREDIAHNLLSSSVAMENVINFMVAEALKNNYYGWQFDIEHIKATDRDAFTAFTHRASDVFKKNNLVFSVAVIVTADPSNKERTMEWSGAFDNHALSQYVDFLSIMTYDDPDSKGPTASIPFVETALKLVLNENVPPNKISLGIPSYYWSWTTDNPPKRVRSGSYDRLLKIKKRTNYTEGFNERLGVPWLYFKENGAGYMVWHENRRSFLLKETLINKYKLRGFSMWVLGMEDPEIWKEL